MYKNQENLKSTLTGKLANALMKVGDVHAKEFSLIVNYYEPKVPMNLLKNEEKK